MALINCPECGTEVSDKAEKCPKCAYPIKPIPSNVIIQNDRPVEVKSEGCFVQTMNFGCQAIFAVIVAIIILSIIVGKCSG
jgi:hypothetical protein